MRGGGGGGGKRKNIKECVLTATCMMSVGLSDNSVSSALPPDVFVIALSFYLSCLQTK